MHQYNINIIIINTKNLIQPYIWLNTNTLFDWEINQEYRNIVLLNINSHFELVIKSEKNMEAEYTFDDPNQFSFTNNELPVRFKKLFSSFGLGYRNKTKKNRIRLKKIYKTFCKNKTITNVKMCTNIKQKILKKVNHSHKIIKKQKLLKKVNHSHKIIK